MDIKTLTPSNREAQREPASATFLGDSPHAVLTNSLTGTRAGGNGTACGYGAFVASILELTVNLLDANGDRRRFPIPNLIAEGYISVTTPMSR